MSEDAEPYGADVLRLEVRQDPTGTTIALEGEFDMTGSERFSVLIDDALAANARRSRCMPAGSSSSTRPGCWPSCVPVTQSPRLVWSSGSATRRLRCGASSKRPASKTCCPWIDKACANGPLAGSAGGRCTRLSLRRWIPFRARWLPEPRALKRGGDAQRPLPPEPGGPLAGVAPEAPAGF
jgi:hypothetical protein